MRSLAKHPSYSLSAVIQGSLRLSGCARPGTNVTLVLKRAGPRAGGASLVVDGNPKGSLQYLCCGVRATASTVYDRRRAA